MGSIPRVETVGLGDIPNAGAPSALPPDFTMYKALSGAADVLGDLGQEYNRNQARLQKAMDAKQAIADQVSASRKSDDYGEALRALGDDLKTRHVDDPQNAPKEFLDSARKSADQVLKNAEPGELGHLAKGTAQRIDEELRSLHTWVQLRQTQLIHNNFDSSMNAAMNGAEKANSPQELRGYLDKRWAALAPDSAAIHGDPEKTRSKFEEGATLAWGRAFSDRSPLDAMRVFDNPKGTPLENLPPRELDELRRRAKESFKGQGEKQLLDTLKSGVGQNGRVISALRAGELNAGDVYALQRSNATQQQALKVGLDVDKAAIKSLGLEDTSREKLGDALRRQEKFLDAVETVRRRQDRADLTDNPEELSSLIEAQNKIVKGDKGDADLSAIHEQQLALVTAARNKKISGGRFTTLWDHLATLAPEATLNEQGNTWSWKHFWAADPRQMGNRELNNLFEDKSGPLSEATTEQKNSAWMLYMGMLNDQTRAGGKLDDDAAKKMARRAASLATGKNVGGERR